MIFLTCPCDCWSLEAPIDVDLREMQREILRHRTACVVFQASMIAVMDKDLISTG